MARCMPASTRASGGRRLDGPGPGELENQKSGDLETWTAYERTRGRRSRPRVWRIDPM
ncbi:MAG: hypothetical protein RIS86_1960, partial [Planctomycetota bacterium]